MTVSPSKLPVNQNCLEQISSDWSAHLNWLPKLGITAQRIVDFGCWVTRNPFGYSGGIEQFGLLWTLDASELTVVDIDKQQLEIFREWASKIKASNPECFQGRTIKTVVADIAQPIAQLPSDYFDFAYCENTLYNLKIDQPDYAKVEAAIREMVRVVSPNGHLWVYESKMGVKYEIYEIEGFSVPNPQNEPTNISELFEKAGLIKNNIPEVIKNQYNLEWEYLYWFSKP